MDTPEQMLQKIHSLLEKNPKYKLEAYSFALSALHYTMQKINPLRHITGQEFCKGIRAYALDQFGPMVCSVFEYWGITGTIDFGNIVFAMVDLGLMRKTEEDSINDFKDVYDFKKAFSAKAAIEMQP
ncbi:MAG: hypothetical protein A3G33_11575 [Omnitrophica bacterium RIFCSPLOWO2_12_FULL_44_17]|uniref:Uncharacterized protein n=1 Tax=Candidatus Danuiimicrobium aquiferis TaxID=1801832 RepID=A0A1G1KRU8_9BACT|nr:MAG: hypothetical protein A3B72_09415 [Omnitrophica bacterium RIFCSPHIGHO2_02_FULL_45_28]OGW91227.1 MAG: hypothetical protein A3E74_02950 [Omnitrophica bacterium RIFCSPHIGHO2_12_FULL_44_12]OGW95628.1 MAG: hypothetical protein A3G33_11575 [Omnitrophica bacterium RIFCSPLOWO2_12_FULL_44_17]OGX03659.1 MAG: hypothetical protein A3J12_00920 [Omnitrophica bacterium RIFCSPLOWO2_02_FULL_44_11]